MGLGVVAIADPPTAIRLKVPFSDGLGGVFMLWLLSLLLHLPQALHHDASRQRGLPLPQGQ